MILDHGWSGLVWLLISEISPTLVGFFIGIVFYRNASGPTVIHLPAILPAACSYGSSPDLPHLLPGIPLRDEVDDR